MRITETLQVLSDSTRLRMLRLLAQEELSVAELQEILEMGQSRISSHLGLLRRHDMVSDRKDGKKTYYNLNMEVARSFDLIRFALAEESEEEFWQTDRSALSRIVDRRRRPARSISTRWPVAWEKITSWPFLGCHWSLPSPARAQNHDCRFGGRGGHDLAIVGGESEESILHRQF